MHYRPEIDGLRSLAILPVIFFHAGFAGISGGFLGVDVFLVISGYLITSIILKEQADKRFRLVYFYERRARRILPALFFVLWVSTVAAWFILSPSQLMDFAHSAMATIGFSANIYFWQHINYFTDNTDLLPLLHLWSLGIEEQFYFIFPLLLMALATARRWALLGVLSGLFILSLGSAQWLSSQHSSAAFYLLPTRAWELLAGAGCALYLQRKDHITTPHWAQISSALGLLLLVLSFVFFTPLTAHPSGWTLAPVLGTVLIILYAKPHTYVAQFLSLRPLVWIGLLSYSAYLWHQPLFAFVRHLTRQSELSLGLSGAVIMSTFLMSALSWRFVEQPFRNRAFLSTRRIFTLSGAVMGVSFALMAVISQQGGFPARFNEVQQVLFAHQQVAAQQVAHDPCFLDENSDSTALGEQCKLSPQQPIAMLGDSHASALWNGLNSVEPMAKYSASGCAPLLGDDTASWRPFCPAINAFNFAEVAAQQPEKIYLQANWLMYTEHSPHNDPAITGQRLQATLEHLKTIAPQTQVIVVGDVPQWQPSLISILSDYAKNGLPAGADTYLENASYAKIQALEEVLKAHTEGLATFVSIQDQLCTPEGLCRALVPIGEDGWEPLAWDYGHLSHGGAAFVAGLIYGENPPLNSFTHTP